MNRAMLGPAIRNQESTVTHALKAEFSKYFDRWALTQTIGEKGTLAYISLVSFAISNGLPVELNHSQAF
jgi:hypothetical protein